MRKLAGGIMLLVLLAACGGGGEDPPPPAPVLPSVINISGDYVLDGAGYVRGNLADCAGAGPYADLVVGAPVTVSDGQGKPLAVGGISYSVGTNVYRNQLDQCIFRFAVGNVPQATDYQVVLGRQPPYLTTFAGLLGSGGLMYIYAAPPPVPTTTTTTLGALDPAP